MTERLYHADAFLRSFRGRVTAHGEYRGKASLILDATAFYPEAGGQMADRGTLGGVAVVDVQTDDAGALHHVLDGALPAVGAELDGVIEWPRRRVHMALHTGQHLLSRALIEAAAAETVSARLGETGCTIDVTRDPVPERELAAAEALANAVIDDDLPVRAWFPEPAELAALPLRREPKVASEVRVVAIGEFDYSPCGGTHCTTSAQIGSIRVLGAERYKGMTRIHFTSGSRARGLLGEHSEILARLARELTCSTAEVPGAVDKLRRSLLDARAETTAARDQLAAALAERLASAAAGSEIVAAVPDPALLRPLASRLNAAGKDALLAAATSDGTQVLIARAAGSTLDCGALLKKLAQATGGRGGGKPDHAEGRLPGALDWPASVAAARA
ncbi:MAG TPA: DHHA1 domain-containing protein [Kofleriaceae bacterium]|nr:DHHA1 domain-containing protein [Kofleriaceae bacterium]